MFCAPALRIFLVIALAALVAAPAAAETSGPAAPSAAISSEVPASWADIVRRIEGREHRLAACCKTCRKGKACGDACISRARACTVGPGCACDG